MPCSRAQNAADTVDAAIVPCRTRVACPRQLLEQYRASDRRAVTSLSQSGFAQITSPAAGTG